MRQRTSSVGPKSETLFKDESPANAIEVIVRMRPLLEPYEDEIVWEVDEENNTIKSKIENFDVKTLNLSHPKFYSEFGSSQRFVFDSVEGPGSRTKDIYNKRLKKIVDTVVQGYNGTIFLYGQTTSGKTYTMLGTQKDPGVLPHSLRTLFMTIPKMKNYEFSIKVSYLEIYNELINDLLVPENTNLKILDDPNLGVVVRGLKRQEVASFEDAIYLMSYGEEHRKYRETNANEHSSRSHTIYQVFIESFEASGDGKKKRVSCLNLVDLAGSESLNDNGGNESLTRETGHINKSLFCLTNVIKKLATGKMSHIPYRDSKLTRILSNAVGGNSLTTVICAISPALQNYGQSLSTLRFAQRAKKVKNAATENFVEEGADPKLLEQVRNLKEKLLQSEHHITKVNSLNVQLEDNLQMTKQEVRNLQKEMEELRTMFTKETARQQFDDNLSNSSLLDIMNDDPPMNRHKSRGKSVLNPLNGLYQSTEIFFGDPILGMIEQFIADSSDSATSVSIDNPSIDNYNMKDWSAACLKSKHNYLRELKNLQRNFVSSLEEASQKYISKDQTVELGSQIKAYVGSEFQKIDTIQSKISEHIKKINPTSLKDLLLTDKLELPEQEKKSSDEWLPKENYNDLTNITQSDAKEPGYPNNLQNHYNEVLERLEKKYDEIYNLVTQSFSKGQNESLDMGYNPQLVKKYSFDSSYCTSPSYESLSADTSMVLKNGEVSRSPDRKNSRKLLLGHDERPLSTGKTMPKFTSSFAKLRTVDRERRSISSLADTSVFGNVYLWGSGKDGRLGNGKFSNEATPTVIKDIRFSKIVCGYHNSFGVSQEGLVYGWGRNENGQLGNGTNINTPIPINVTGFNKITIVDIACGWQHCLALSIEGYLFSWGCGDDGQLGHGDDYDLSTPAEVKFFEKTQVTKIACGYSQSAAITAEGSLYTWGHNSDYRLMISTPNSQFIPTLTEFYNYKNQFVNEEEPQIVSLSMGATHMCIVTSNGDVFTAGRGHEGQLGKKLTKDMKNVAVLKTEQEEGEALSSEEILCSYFTQVEAFNPYNKGIMASCGEKFTLVLNGEHKVYSFGDASDGCLGIELEENERNIYQPRLVEKLADVKVTSIEAGPRHAACITETEDLFCWGFNYYDQIEVGEKAKDYHIPKKVEKLAKQNVIAVSCGYFHTASLVR